MIFHSFHTFTMQLQKYTFFGHYVLGILFCNFMFHELVSSKALVGPNVRQAMVDEFPFIAGIIRHAPNVEPERDTICTAALITKRDILTAEHCLEEDLWHDVRIIIGSIDLASPIKHYVCWWLSYAQWSMLKEISNGFDINDVSILRLTENVENEMIYAEISYLPYNELKDKSVVAVGWGRTNNNLLPTTLQTDNLNILNTTECRRRIERVSERVRVDENLLCSVGEPFTLIMFGDSGGPILYNNKIVAINRGTCPFPELDYHPNKINLHTNIYFYEDFLSDITST